jgi:hypothetical protein
MYSCPFQIILCFLFLTNLYLFIIIILFMYRNLHFLHSAEMYFKILGYIKFIFVCLIAHISEALYIIIIRDNEQII